MTDTPPGHKDTAEFFRLSLVAGLCDVSAVIPWADSVVSAEASPHIAMIELCCCGSQPLSTVQTLLSEIPGVVTPGLPVEMLLGFASHLVETGTVEPEQLLLRLHRMISLEDFPDSISSQLDILEDGYYLAQDSVWGTVPEVLSDFSAFLKGYEQHAPAFVL